MIFPLPYGNTSLNLDIQEKNIAGVIMPNEIGIHNKSPEERIAHAMANPIGSKTLASLAQSANPKKTCVIISDVTRPLPYDLMLPLVLRELHQSGVSADSITIVIATGAHRPNTPEETLQALGKEIVEKYKIVNHNCDLEQRFMGKLSDGTELWLNSTVAEADFKVALGIIIPHNLAGFSGGSKAILPGVSGRQSIVANHQMMNKPNVSANKIQDNPVRGQMNEAARLVNLNFILNVVTDHKDRLAAAVAGDPISAWMEGVKLCQRQAAVTVPYKSQAAIISCGGYPRDMNVYQAIKPMVNGKKFVVKGGTVVAVAKCQEAYGDETFAQWLKNADNPEDMVREFAKGFVLGGHKGYVLANLVKDCEVVLVSDLTEKQTNKLFMKYKPNLEQAIDYLKQKHGDDYKAWVVPYAGILMME